MLADERTLLALDFASIRDRVIAATQTQRGRAYAEQLAPLGDFDAVRREQQRTAELRELIASADFHVQRAIDTVHLTEGAAVGSTLGAEELRAIGDACAAAAAAYNATRVRDTEAIAGVTASYRPLKPLIAALTDAIDERGIVQDRASPALGRIRRSLAQAQADARDRVTGIARSGNRAIQDSVVMIRDGRFVVPIKAEFSGEFAGIVHDTSSSGQTVFVEPLAALDANNRVRTLRLEEEHEVSRILRELSRQVGANATAIEANVEMLAQLDVIAARAALARRMDANPPNLVDEPGIKIVRGRHPLLGGRAVAQSLELADATRVLVISGPNMGGKTVALKMAGLFILMTYCGLQLPAAEGTTIGYLSSVIADIGDEQSIAENTSTFSAHLRRMREIVERADARSLVLVDEIGGGTEPASGAALAIAFLERLLRGSVLAIVTTHATELKLFAHGTPGVVNASVRFDPQSFAPTYHLDVGAPGQSLAFALARSLGIRDEIIERAQSLLESRERDYESALAELAQRNAELQSERDRAANARREIEREAAALVRDREKLARSHEQFNERAEARMRDALRDFVAQLQRSAASRPRVTHAQSAQLERTLEEMRRELGITPQQTQAVEAETSFAPGDRVRVASYGQEGTIVEDYGDNVLVAMGILKSVVPRRELQRLSARATKREGSSGTVRLEAARRTASELDVRGKRFVEAQPVVEQWIEDAVLAGQTPLRLIHGKGTGQLGRGLQEYLREHPSVATVRYGNADEGDGGVSIVELRQ